MNMVKVIDYIHSKLKNGPLHMTLIDPDKQPPEAAGRIAKEASGCGTSAIMVGGSTGIEKKGMEETITAIKSYTDRPVICFPSSASGLSRDFDAIYFLSMLNSASPRHITGEQAAGAQTVKSLGIEPIGMGYLIIEPGMKVGEVGRAVPIRRTDIDTAVGYALAAEYFGMKLVYLEAGSGSPEPVPGEMIRAVKNAISVPLIVGGGIRDRSAARMVVTAGADIIVTGTVIEHNNGVENLCGIIDAINSAGKRK